MVYHIFVKLFVNGAVLCNNLQNESFFFYKEDLRDSGNLYYGIFMNLLGTNLIDENMQENMVIQTTF